MVDVIYLTKEGYERKKNELDHLIRARRPQVLERIKQCQDRGDLEEEGGDTEFQEAQREQAWVESRIEELRKVLAVSEVLEPDQVPLERVGYGSVVHLQDLDTLEKRVCQIVSGIEADPSANKISAESPVGTALFDRTRGETVEVKIPAGLRRYKILKLATAFRSSPTKRGAVAPKAETKPAPAKPSRKPVPVKPAKKAPPVKPAKKARPVRPAKKARPVKPAKKAPPVKPARKPTAAKPRKKSTAAKPARKPTEAKGTRKRAVAKSKSKR